MKWFCRHDWKILVKEKIILHNDLYPTNTKIVIVLVCKKCGKLKKKEIKY
jgi:DNA-directed RNA polymerase subunit M/transcription elongation factor TFIIS